MSTNWPVRPRMRVVIDNDFAGDPDGLVQLAHHLLSPSVEVVAVISSHLRPDDTHWNKTPDSVARGLELAAEVIEMCGAKVPVLAGSRSALTSLDQAQPSEALDFLVSEVQRDAETELFFACGGSLTQLASLQLAAPPGLARMTAIWIGGPEHPSVNPPRFLPEIEYNLAEDRLAGQIVFNGGDYDFWQIPRDAYRQTIISRAELRSRMRPAGPLGDYLYRHLAGVAEDVLGMGGNIGETYVLGDSPLVLLTALQTSFEQDAGSSQYRLLPSPRLDANGRYLDNPDGRPIRVYHHIDNRTMFEDFFAKLDQLAEGKQ